MATRKTLPPAQTAITVTINKPASPTHGCHDGISIGEVSLSNIRVGVKGGINDIQVEKPVRGSLATGIMMNIGMMIGSIAGKVSD